jgi:hypothetical protein
MHKSICLSASGRGYSQLFLQGIMFNVYTTQCTICTRKLLMTVSVRCAFLYKIIKVLFKFNSLGCCARYRPFATYFLRELVGHFFAYVTCIFERRLDSNLESFSTVASS